MLVVLALGSRLQHYIRPSAVGRALISPADVASSLIVAASFLLFFAIGANSRPLVPPTAS